MNTNPMQVLPLYRIRDQAWNVRCAGQALKVLGE